MFGISTFILIAAMFCVICDNSAFMIQDSTFYIENNIVNTADISSGISCHLLAECASICEKLNCCSASFSAVKQLCIPVSYDDCFNGFSSTEDWNTVIRCLVFLVFVI